VDNASRSDLLVGYEVALTSINVAATYLWSLSFIPDRPDGTASAAVFLAPDNANSQTANFVVDNEGTYLVRLLIDSGLGTEDVQYVALRCQTDFAQLELISPTEQRDPSENIPVDISTKGWAGIQNKNMQRMLALLRRTATSGRTLFVDANRGRDNTETPNTLANEFELPGSMATSAITMAAVAHGDFSSVQDAIDYAADAVSRGEPAPSSTNPWTILIQPGLYAESLTLEPFVNLVGLGYRGFEVGGVFFPGNPTGVQLRTAGSSHVFNGGATDIVCVENLQFECIVDVAYPTFDLTGGVFHATNCAFLQKFLDATAPAFRVVRADANVNALMDSCFFSCAVDAVDPTSWVVEFDAPSQLSLVRCHITGVNGILANPNADLDTCVVILEYTRIETFGDGIQGPVDLTLRFSKCGTVLLNAHGGASTVTDNLTVTAEHSNLDGLELDTTCTSGDVNVYLTHTACGPITFPTGNPTTFSSTGHPVSVAYSVWTDNPNWVNTVPMNKRLTTSPGLVGSVYNVQDAIDELSTRIGTRAFVAPGATPYVVPFGREIIGVDPAAAPFSVELPATPPTGAGGGITISTQITVKDISGTAASYPITITTSDGSLIDGGASAVISTNYGSVNLFFDGTNWYTF
jgi:hypothetical protein